MSVSLSTLAHLPPSTWLAILGGLGIAAVAMLSALGASRRTRMIETLVAQRTAELAQINEKLAEEICDHLSTEHALDKERELLKAVLNNLHEGILVLDGTGKVRIVNGAALRIYRSITGMELTRIDELTLAHYYGAEAGSGTLAAPHTRALCGETVRDCEMTVDAQNSMPVVLSISAQPLFTSDGRQHGAVIVIRDITAYKRVERLKAEFVSIVSHELRTPITSIRGSLGLIASGASGPVSGKTSHLIDIALRNSDRLAHLINDLLDIEKIESGKMRFDTAHHSLRTLIEHAVEANTGYAQSFNVRLVFTAPRSDATVHVDAHRLLQVLTNLLSNAVKFSPPESTVDIAMTHFDSTVRVTVRDRGPGIPPEFHERIFQKFSQADSSDARGKGGTGLGLAICKALIEQMGGRIGFDTSPGCGTTFFFELPMAEPLREMANG